MNTAPADDIREMFSRLVPEYNRFNQWSSLGMDRLWRRAVVSQLPPGSHVLDVGTGTGDLLGLSRRRGHSGVGLDISLEMLRETGRNISGASLVQASAGALPFSSERFDAVVSAYVLRNLQQCGLLAESLAEFHRVLAPGGKLVFLDLTRPRFGPLRWGHWIYLKTVLPAVGRACFGARWPGVYLRRSIAELPSEDRLRSLWKSAGFRSFDIRPLWGGVVSLFIGSK